MFTDDEYSINEIKKQDILNKKYFGKLPFPIVNIALMGAFFFFLFFAFNTTQNFETTLNANLGFWSLSVLYLAFSISTLFSSIFVRQLGEKYCLVIGSVCYTLYIAANIQIYKGILLVITAAFVGFGAAILWNAQGSLLGKCSTQETSGMLSGVFFSVFQVSTIAGNLFAGILLSKDIEHWILYTCLTISAVISNICFFMIQNVDTREQRIEATQGKGLNIFETVSLFKNQKMLLLVSLFIFSGLSQSFYYGNFTQLVGEYHQDEDSSNESSPSNNNEALIGYVMAIFGVVEVLGSFANGKLSDKLGKPTILYISSASAYIGFILVLISLYKNYGQNNFWIYFVTALFFGYSDSGFNTMIYSLLSTIFPDNMTEQCFGFFKLVQASTTAVAFFYSPYVPVPYLIMILCFFLTLGLITFFTLHRLYMGTKPVDQSTKNTKYDGVNDDDDDDDDYM